MEQGIKFTQEELKAIAALQEQYGRVTFRFGQLYIEKDAIEARITQNAVEFDNTKKELETTRGQERNLALTFQQKYGDGQLNLETGVFTPTPKPPAAVE